MALIDRYLDIFFSDFRRAHSTIMPSHIGKFTGFWRYGDGLFHVEHQTARSNVPSSQPEDYPLADNISFALMRLVIVSFTGTGIPFSLASLTIAPLSASISSFLPALIS